MRTDELNRIKADRRIPLTIVDMLFEILGNMSGPIRKWYYDEDMQTLYIYHNDKGFSEKDEKAIQMKNSSGDNSNTVGLNGHGIKLTVDRLLPKDKRCDIVSINTRRTCTIGHFDCTEWTDWGLQNDYDDILQKMEINKNDGGSFIKIPFDNEFHDLYMKEREMLKTKALLMLNIKIAEKTVFFYWNNELQHVDKICPDEGCVTLNVDLGYDSKSESLHENHKKPFLMCINNYDELDDSIKNILPSRYIALGKGTLKPYNMEYKFRSFENLTMRLNSVETQTNTYFDEKDQDGVLVYINEESIVPEPLLRLLGLESGTLTKTYNGKPRFSMHISKDSIIYFIPQDKTNIKLTTKGEHLHRFIHQFGTNYFTQRNNSIETQTDDNNNNETQTDDNNNNETQTDDNNNNETQTDDNSDDENSDITQYTSPCNNSIDTTSSTNIFADICSNNEAPIVNEPKKRGEFSTSTKDQALLQYQNNKESIDNNHNGPDRCLCCDRILKRSQQVGGHIISDNCDGSTDLDNCLIICTRCNNNDIRPIPEMMIEEWGVDHINTQRVEKYLLFVNKQGKNIIPNKRTELLGKGFISQTQN